MSKKMNFEVCLMGIFRKLSYNYEVVVIKCVIIVLKIQDYVVECVIVEVFYKGVDIDSNVLYIKGFIEVQFL